MVCTTNKADVYAAAYAFLLDFKRIILIKKLRKYYAIGDFFCDTDDVVHFVSHFEGTMNA